MKLLKETYQSKTTAKEVGSFLKEFLFKEMGLITVGVLLYLILINVFSHHSQSVLMTVFVLLFAVIKVAYFLLFTLNRLEKHLRHNAFSFYRCLSSFSTIIILLILSFSLDYVCLSDCNALAFEGIQASSPLIYRFLEFNYFSVVTFATIGFGDIVPASLGAKLLVMLEITTSFFMVVFILSNFYNLHFYYRDNNRGN